MRPLTKKSSDSLSGKIQQNYRTPAKMIRDPKTETSPFLSSKIVMRIANELMKTVDSSMFGRSKRGIDLDFYFNCVINRWRSLRRLERRREVFGENERILTQSYGDDASNFKKSEDVWHLNYFLIFGN